jgi:hypothetical protein
MYSDITAIVDAIVFVGGIGLSKRYFRDMLVVIDDDSGVDYRSVRGKYLSVFEGHTMCIKSSYFCIHDELYIMCFEPSLRGVTDRVGVLC